MSENEPVARPARARWRERTWSLPALVVVALVAVLLGGLGGAALASAGDHQDGRRGPGFGQGPGGPGMMFQHRQPGQHRFRFGTPPPRPTPTPAPSS